MSQKTKTIQVGNTSFTLKELPVQVLWDLINNEINEKEDKENNMSILDRGRELLNLACPELTKDELLKLYPSEIEELWEGFKEVNSSFLAVARTIGLGEALTGAVRGIVTSSIKLSALSLCQATDRKPGSTGTGSFLRRLKPW